MEVRPNEISESENLAPEWLLGKWLVDTITVNYTDGRVSKDAKNMVWEINTKEVRITHSIAESNYQSTNHFKYRMSNTGIVLIIDDIPGRSKVEELYILNKISNAEINLTIKSSAFDQTIHAKKM